MSLLNPIRYARACARTARLLGRYRHLTWELTKQEVFSRYAGQMFGSLWAIGHPLFLVSLYVFVFSYIFPLRLGLDIAGDRGLAVYILAGLVPWMTFADAMAKSAVVVVNNANMVKQIVFPVETLPVKTVLASVVTQVVLVAGMFLFMLVRGEDFPLTILLLPVLMVIQIIAMTGVAYMLAAFGVFVRDLKDVVQVFLTAGLYLAPIIYLPSMVEGLGKGLAWVLWINPFTHLVWCYQDAIFYGSIIHPASWVITIGLSIGIFVVGCAVFDRLKRVFGDLL